MQHLSDRHCVLNELLIFCIIQLYSEEASEQQHCLSHSISSRNGVLRPSATAQR